MDQRANWPVSIAPPPPTTPTSTPVAPEEVGLPPVQPRSRLRRALGPLAALGAAGAKFAGSLKALIFLLPKLKLLTTSGTMLVSIAAYSLIWGWRFAAGFVALLFIHEMGHVIQLRREGIKASAPMFIPFLGAVVAAKSLGRNALAEARVGLAGPVLGSLGAALLIPVWHATGNPFWQALAFAGLFINLFNLLPVVPLDGGRAMAAMAPWMWFLGFAAMVALAIAFPNPIILIILLFGGMETWRRWQARRAGGAEAADYYRVKAAHRALVAVVYIGLIAALVLGMDATHLHRTI
jgi:Zn-dependent protease